MILQERRFEMVGSVHPARRADGTISRYRPQSRYTQADTKPLHQYGDGDFCTFRFPDAPQEPGVYAMYIGDKMMYVGEAKCLKQRLYAYGQISPRNCFVGGRQTNCRINKLILEAMQKGQDVQVWFHACDDRKQLEADLKDAFRPPWNL
jgi:hypothetical protein